MLFRKIKETQTLTLALPIVGLNLHFFFLFSGVTTAPVFFFAVPSSVFAAPLGTFLIPPLPFALAMMKVQFDLTFESNSSGIMRDMFVEEVMLNLNLLSG